jgi:16S rRNA (adenine1518-N6/adenine1519-N6)-dimethyltransferase
VVSPPSLPPLREVIRDHGLRAEKALGQNFLLDQNLTDKIVRLSGEVSPEMTLLEIGPGPGGLTRSLLQTPAKKVVAIEFDARAVLALSSLSQVYSGRLQVIEGDALTVDFLEVTSSPRAVLANLPYNISTVLLLKWLQQIRNDSSSYSFLSLMFQKEVADRILSGHGNKVYGRLSVLAQWLCDVKRLFDLPPAAFTPPPKVSSTVLHFRPRTLQEDSPSFAVMEEVLAAAFQQRRKMIRSSLSAYLPSLESSGIQANLRAEDLSVSDYVCIAQDVERSRRNKI